MENYQTTSKRALSGGEICSSCLTVSNLSQQCKYRMVNPAFSGRDNWIQQPLKLEYPELFSFAKNKKISVNMLYSQQQLQSLFSLPLSIEAFQQMQLIQAFIENFPLNDQNDKWTSFGGNFSASKAYKFLIGHRQTHPAFKWLWKSCCQPKHKVFLWLLMKDRLSTKNILRRKNMHLDSYNCDLCQMLTEETTSTCSWNVSLQKIAGT